MTVASAPALRCRALVKRYDGGVVAVDGLDLEVPVGECFGLLGPNGAGKTTTVEVLEGLLDPTAGDVEVLGMRWATDERALRERLGVSLQQTHLPERLTVDEILRLFRSFFARGRRPDDVGEYRVRLRRLQCSQGRSHVRPRMAGNTFDSRLTMYASVYLPCAINRMYSGTLVWAGQAHWQSTTL